MTPNEGKPKFNPQTIIDEQVEQLNAAITRIEKRMKPYEELAQRRLQLVAARRALMGTGPRMTGGNTTRLTLDDIVKFLEDNAGASPGQIAEQFGVTQGTVSSHLYRNKDRFIKRDGLYWVRNPGEGLNDASDLEEDEDEE